MIVASFSICNCGLNRQWDANACSSISCGKEKETNQKEWMKPWLKRIAQDGACNVLMKELSTEDSDDYSNFIRMDTQLLQIML